MNRMSTIQGDQKSVSVWLSRLYEQLNGCLACAVADGAVTMLLFE
jgi:G3E family GTPase